ncbi:MAG: MBL fold metallo-hydrolase [Sphingomonas sp.]|uniref:MBL fold metallo-hydrolase n=1 Tax=Sphingomonas sp. TaxID=28214 RepID=UPI001ACBF9FD|nr:MBL fold metallo-hydrolase [Sphingomonas sp.]MBN8814318.1 MBL fold metallo-hydrolase [Sphingomonas sp.]
MKKSTKAVLAAFCGSLALAGVSAQTLPSASFTTLGTNSGPIPNPRRGEPANLLRADGQTILIDAGDGAAWQLGKSGVELGKINTIFISHLHFDHTGGLFAVLGQRFQTLNSTPITIYGPRGTKAVVAGLVTALTASVEGAMNMRARMPGAPGDNIKVVELDDGASFALGQIRVTAASNSHFSATPGSEATKRATLSFRFDTPGRSIVYTGDTGPSAAVEKLAKNADLLVSEIMDPDEAIARRRKQTPDRPEAVWKMISEHFYKEHLSPTEVGLLASRANVKMLVLTHNALPPEIIDRARTQIQANFKGPIQFAEDLNSF